MTKWAAPLALTRGLLVGWYRLAAAQYNLGLRYASGEGVPQDDDEAMRWFCLAAEQGYAAAQYNLGVTYATGEGVPQDRVAVYMWLSLAAMRFSPSALGAFHISP